MGEKFKCHDYHVIPTLSQIYRQQLLVWKRRKGDEDDNTNDNDEKKDGGDENENEKVVNEDVTEEAYDDECDG
jgi:hypothetical protein